MDKPSYVGFKSNEYHWKPDIDYKENPHLYKVGRGQQGVLICQPYKSELHIHWRFKTPDEARQSAQTIYMMFLDYLEQGDFVGADMAKKYLHMGFTRARRYWNHSSGKKWTRENGKWEILPKDHNVERFFRSSNIFQDYWKRARENEDYRKMKKEFMCR
jgi:hypothetical protein